MKIDVYGKSDCGKCESAKKKLIILNLKYTEHDIEYHTKYHEGWRTDGSVDVTAAYNDIDDLPLIKIGDVFYTYSQAMKKLKKKGK